MVADLEEVLAVEASRTGQATGEVTTRAAHAARPAQRRRCPGACAIPARWARSLGAARRDRRDRARARRRRSAPRRGRRRRASSRTRACEPVQLGQTAAHDYNPFGTGPENRDLVGNVVDGDPNTTWSTEQYYDGTLEEGRRRRPRHLPRRRAAGARQGDRDPDAHARLRRADLRRPTTSTCELAYGNSTPLVRRGWQGPVGTSADVHSGERIPLTLDGHPHRYYLVWLTTLPPRWSRRRSPS